MNPIDILIKQAQANKLLLDTIVRVLGNLAIEPTELKGIEKMVSEVHETYHDVLKFFDGVKDNESVTEVLDDAVDLARLAVHADPLSPNETEKIAE